MPGNGFSMRFGARRSRALVEEDVCAPEDVDTIVKRRFALRLPVFGPLQNVDLVALALIE